MDGRKLQDRFYLSLGLSARHIGQSTDVFRPSGPMQPLAKQNRFLRLSATFTSSYGKFSRVNEYGDALWFGIFDASYTRCGDYLVADHATFFVASQAPLLPVLCVRTNRVVSITQPNMLTGAVGNAYGGYTQGGSISLMEGWPASIFGASKTSRSTTDLPTDQMVPFWNVLVPAPAGVLLSPGDIIMDDLGRTAIISGSELTDLGWRLSARMATT